MYIVLVQYRRVGMNEPLNWAVFMYNMYTDRNKSNENWNSMWQLNHIQYIGFSANLSIHKVNILFIFNYLNLKLVDGINLIESFNNFVPVHWFGLPI